MKDDEKRRREEIRRRLDAVVGDQFDPPREWRASILKWLAAAVLAIAAAATIATILHTYLTKAETAPPPPRPVTIQIVPAK